jgi:DNA-binding MarR family transcriptional regulator
LDTTLYPNQYPNQYPNKKCYLRTFFFFCPPEEPEGRGERQSLFIKRGICAMSATPKDNPHADVKQRQQGSVTHEEEYQFFILMKQVVEGMTKAREKELRPFGISPIQSGVLYVLDAAKSPVAPSQIARRLLRNPASIHQLLDRMENQEVVRRIRSTEGKREVQVVMTKKGKEIHRKHRREVIPKILGRLSQKERKQLRTILVKLREATYVELSPQPLFP